VNTAKKTMHLEVVKDMADTEINVLKEILLTDPIKIDAAIEVWTKRKQKAADDAERQRCDTNIENLYTILEKAISTTLSVYAIEKKEETNEVAKPVKEETTMVHEQPIQTEEVEQPTTALRVVRDDDELAKKYESIVKKLSVDDLGKHLQSLSVADATEAAHYILGNGLYHATNPKKWDEKKIAGFLKSAVFKKKNKKQVAEETATTIDTLEEKYKDVVNKLTLAEIGEKIKEYVANDKATEALEFATYLLSKKAYINADKEDLEWTYETITTYIDQIVSGMSSEINIEEATVVEEESPFYDITYGEVYKLIDEKAQAEGATIESVKAFFVDFMNTNTEKSIEKIDDLIEQSNIDTVWADLFEQTIAYRIKSLNEKRQAEQFEKEHEELKTSILEKHLEENIIAKKKEYEEGTLKPTDGITEIKKLLIEKGFVNTNLQTAKQYFMDMARRAAINVKWLKPTPSPLPEATETTNTEKVAFVSPNVSVDDKFPDIKAKVEAAKYLEDFYFLSREFVNDEDKNAYVLQLITNAFADKKVYETASSETPLDWTIEQVQAWLNTEMRTEEPVQTVETEVTEPVAETPVVDAQTDLNPKEETETNDFQNRFCAANNREKFISVLVDYIKELKSQDMDVKAIRSKCVENIQYAARNNKKSFARSSYKKAQIGELHNAINKIAINANIDGFMNEPKH